jgi:hypothetical protein
MRSRYSDSYTILIHDYLRTLTKEDFRSLRSIREIGADPYKRLLPERLHDIVNFIHYTPC